MRFMLLQTYSGPEGVPPIWQWAPDDVKAHIQFQHDLNADLTASGELVDAQGLAGPDEARIVTSDGVRPPVVTDGPFAESREFLAGFRIVDVDSVDRAIEIAARCSAAPGPEGAPIGQEFEVRQIMAAPDPEM